MGSDIIHFYSLFIILLASAFGVIFSPRMFLSVLSFFFLICSSSLLYLELNAKYIAVFQFILCGLFLMIYLFLLLKKIGRFNLNLKLVQTPKMLFSALFVVMFGILTYLFFDEEFNSSLYSIFNFVEGKSADVINFSMHLFPLHLVIILVFVTSVVLRIFLEKPVKEKMSISDIGDDK